MESAHIFPSPSLLHCNSALIMSLHAVHLCDSNGSIRRETEEAGLKQVQPMKQNLLTVAEQGRARVTNQDGGERS